jgi:hypothetical protein
MLDGDWSSDVCSSDLLMASSQRSVRASALAAAAAQPQEHPESVIVESFFESRC